MPWGTKIIKYKTAIFRQINKESVGTHHDALEFPDGQIAVLNWLASRPRFFNYRPRLA